MIFKRRKTTRPDLTFKLGEKYTLDVQALGGLVTFTYNGAAFSQSTDGTTLQLTFREP